MSKIREITVEVQGVTFPVFIGGDKNTITVAMREVKKNSYQVGVSRCGDNENYLEKLGVDIAINRSKIQPYGHVTTDNPIVLKGVAELIITHMDCAKQPQIQNCERIEKKHKKTIITKEENKVLETTE